MNPEGPIKKHITKMHKDEQPIDIKDIQGQTFDI
jgi:hypothetical protein